MLSAADGGVLSFAGLRDRWKNPETGEPVTSCTIIATDANELTRPIHDRMPVILDKADFAAWLSGTGGTELLRSAADNLLRMWPVSRRVNKTESGDDDVEVRRFEPPESGHTKLQVLVSASPGYV